MGYVKSMLPEDWEPDQDYPKYKYYCVSGIHNPNIRDKWLPRWYGVPHTECAFTLEKLLNDSEIDLGSRSYLGIYGMHPDAIKQSNIIRLPVLPEGSDYKQKLKELKLEKLLNGK